MDEPFITVTSDSVAMKVVPSLKVSESGVSSIVEDKKGNVWTAGKLEFNGKVWALSVLIFCT